MTTTYPTQAAQQCLRHHSEPDDCPQTVLTESEAIEIRSALAGALGVLASLDGPTGRETTARLMMAYAIVKSAHEARSAA